MEWLERIRETKHIAQEPIHFSYDFETGEFDRNYNLSLRFSNELQLVRNQISLLYHLQYKLNHLMSDMTDLYGEDLAMMVADYIMSSDPLHPATREELIAMESKMDEEIKRIIANEDKTEQSTDHARVDEFINALEKEPV